MRQAANNPVLRWLRALATPAEAGAQTDARLLERFAVHRDEVAFAELVRRHRPLVLGVCRRLLRHDADAEDAFQATFLILARKAGSVRKGESLASFLYGVALRVARKVRASTPRRQARQKALADLPATEKMPAWERHEYRAVLDEEVGRLPVKYRVPFVLCHLEGRTNEEAARQLGRPLGMVLAQPVNDKVWIVLEKTTENRAIRYFIDPDSYLIWRTQMKGLPAGETRFDGWLTRFQPLNTVDEQEFLVPKEHRF
jgi:RNA polymerase sigma factor (sigma-70 family)